MVFILWGNNALSKMGIITNPNHYIIKSPHPSPLSASRGFLGSKPFSKTNNFLSSKGKTPIDWQIENL
ncbi:Uracil-DNA glycosylase, family 1 [Desulfosporosinus sp. I2]|nr:Uracil-DNA glycosylase, family 1 [Desulfosporosinus sp. I2]